MRVKKPDIEAMIERWKELLYLQSCQIDLKITPGRPTPDSDATIVWDVEREEASIELYQAVTREEEATELCIIHELIELLQGTMTKEQAINRLARVLWTLDRP